MKKIASNFLISITLFNLPMAFSADNNIKENSISDFALPSEVGDIKKGSGSVFYSPTGRKKVLMPVNFWGEIKQSGMHYIPVGSTVIKGLSLAGGPTGRADLGGVFLSRYEKGKEGRFQFDLSKPKDVSLVQLRPGDTVFIERDTTFEDRSFYTGLISIAFTVLSSILIIQKINDD